MGIRVSQEGTRTVLVVDRVFSEREAAMLRSLLLDAGAGPTVEIDFTGTAEIHPVALATLVQIAGEGGRAVRTRGLGVAHRRLLGYLGLETPRAALAAEEA